MADSLNQGDPPAGVFNSIAEWEQTWGHGAGQYSGGRVIPFEFGGTAEFTAPYTLETHLHPVLTPYCLQPFGGYLAVIPGGRLWGRSGAVLSAEGRLIFELSQEYGAEEGRMLMAEEHPVFRQWNQPQLLEMDGILAVLTFCGSYNYFHWLYDVLPRYAMLQAAGIPYSRLVMNPNPYGAFAEQALAMLGIPEASVIRAGPDLYIRSECLLVPSLMMNSHYPPWTTLALRQLLLPHRQAALHTPGRIFISRRQALTRRIVNEEAVLRCLQPHGFVPVCLEDFTLAEQIQLFAAADIIAGPHGAGLANLAFCRPGTRVIEIFHAGHVVPTYWMISNHNALKYYMLYAEGSPGSAVNLAGLEDIVVDIERLLSTLKLAEQG
ncbi:glycosyltransferase family 61 protein ['Paenibacillus yunnanensis' Narsing Rao et al. 2020]|uniref:glycosyltransferase family 61 protein n=1 Tax=Paenibacillus tengchongensis TaxID=2608684 RepID=UPI00124ECF62|nr:glycosyltransferase family 61 protein [Paenibacillus tengchongensis]